MKSRLLSGIFTVIVLTTLFTAYSYAQNSIQGHVYYNDDYSLVTTGVVNAYDLSGNYVAESIINPDGSYLISGLGGVQYDIIGIPDVGPEDDQPYVPTGYPNKTDPGQMVSILGLGNVANMDIYVQRTAGPGGGMKSSSFVTGKVTSNGEPIANANVYAQIGDKYYGFGTTDSKGVYKIRNISAGDYVIIVHRIGSASAFTNVHLTSAGMSDVNFSIEPLKKQSLSSEPVEFKLSQNYPNPFNPSTVIGYVLPKDGFVSLRVYNTLGEEVSVLINGQEKAGANSVRFDGANLSSGVYFYTLKAGDFVETKRMVLVK